MQAHIDNTRRKLGELATMSHQTQEAERKILAKAEEMLQQVMKDIPAAKAESMMGDDKRYLHLIGERGRLQQVIATSRKHLAS